jgi:hypothetical protein
VDQAELLQDPYLQAFIGAKGVEADERGVSLRIGPETLVRGQVAEPQDVTTVLGNLIDNAVNAAVAGTAAERWVELELLDDEGDGGTLHVVVADSGDGLPDGGNPEAVFAEGFTTAGGGTVLQGVRAGGKAWAWPWRGSWRGGAAGTSRCWSPEQRAARAPCSWPRCRALPRRGKTDGRRSRAHYGSGRKDEDV